MRVIWAICPIVSLDNDLAAARYRPIILGSTDLLSITHKQRNDHFNTNLKLYTTSLFRITHGIETCLSLATTLSLSRLNGLTHWGSEVPTCMRHWTRPSIVQVMAWSGGLMHVRYQAITWTNADLLLIEIQSFSLMKTYLNRSSAKYVNIWFRHSMLISACYCPVA